MDLAGRTVLLTGASGGIGSALAAELVARDARVVAVGRDPSRLDALARRHPAETVLPCVADLGEDTGRATLVALAHRLRPAPSVLVLAHARGAFGLFEAQDPAEMRALVETNLLGPMLLVRALLPLLQRQQQAAVVAVGSTFGSLAFPGFAAYSASKFGLRGLIEGLSREHADGSVRFQHLAPRATRTPFNPPAVDALNSELRVAVDAPEAVARALVAAIVRGDRRRQFGWPEKLFARINGVLPALVDRSLAGQLPTIRRHARAEATHVSQETTHEIPSH